MPAPDHGFVINRGGAAKRKLSAKPAPAKPVEDAFGVVDETDAAGKTGKSKASAAGEIPAVCF